MSSFQVLDNLFKPGPTSLKRKLDVPKNSGEIYKSAKLRTIKTVEENNEIASNRNEEDLETEPESVTRLDDEIYGPQALDDEEGRFFGGGVSQRENEILDYVDGMTSTEPVPEKINAIWLRKRALRFEKIITKNAQLRVRYEDEPRKFMDSEADLHAEIKALSILSEYPELYAEFVNLGCITSLVSLLSHENTDIVIGAVEIISELTDETVEAEQSQWNTIVNAMVEADLLSLLVSNLKRLDENIESDRNGIYYLLSILENLASMSALAERIGNNTPILDWLIERIRKGESPVSQNKQYSAEILAILLHSSIQNAKKFCEKDGVNIFLELLAYYRKRDPIKGTEEEEYVENMFDALTCVVNLSEGKNKFVEAEGVELCLIMIKEGKMSKSRALRLLDHSLGSYNGLEACERLVEAGGLKVIFSIFMKKKDGANTEHILGIFSSLLRLLIPNSAYRIRTLAKFVENDYQKIGRLIELRRYYASRVLLVDERIRKEYERMNVGSDEAMEDERLSKRLDAGLFCLQMIDVILAWLVAEDDGASGKIKLILAEKDETLTLLSKSLKEQISFATGDTEDEEMTRDMLSTLVQFLT